MNLINLAEPADLEPWQAVDLEAQRTAAGAPCPRCGAEGERHDRTGSVACPIAWTIADAWNQDPEGTAEAFGSFGAGEFPHDDDQEEPDEAAELEQEEQTGRGFYACGCEAGGTGGNRPHRFIGFCRTCALATGGPGWAYACGAPHRSPDGWDCRCNAPDLTQDDPGWRKASPPGQLSLF